MNADLQAIRDTANSTILSGEARRIVDWALNQLPRLYRELAQTNEVRSGEEILRVVRAALKVLAGEAPALAEVFTTRLHAMHDRLAIPRLSFGPAPVKRPSPRRAS